MKNRLASAVVIVIFSLGIISPYAFCDDSSASSQLDDVITDTSTFDGGSGSTINTSCN